MNRKEVLAELGFNSINDIPDTLLYKLADYYKELNMINKKEQVLLKFINFMLEKNNAQKITKLTDFINISREKLLFSTIPQELQDYVLTEFNIAMKNLKEDDCGSLYVKKMVKQIPGYMFSCNRKEIPIIIDGVKKKKSTMFYNIIKPQ